MIRIALTAAAQYSIHCRKCGADLNEDAVLEQSQDKILVPPCMGCIKEAFRMGIAAAEEAAKKGPTPPSSEFGFDAILDDRRP